MKRLLFYVFICVFVGQFVLFVQCSHQTVNSHWADEAIAVDGEIGEWETAMYYDEKLDASYGIQNDGEYLYVAFETGNQALQRQLLMSGLVIWVNDTGDKTRDVGFKFPRGLMERRVPARDLMAALGNASGVDDQRLAYLIDQDFRDVQVLDPKNKNLGIYTKKEALDHNIHFDLNIARGLMIYELQIPLQGSSRHTWNFDVASIGVGFKTPEFDRSQFGGRGPRGGGMMDASNGGGGMGGGRGGGRGGGMGGGMEGDKSGGMEGMGSMSGGFRQMKDVDVWITATLAKK